MSRTPIHPGEHLASELEEIGVSSAELARQLRVPANRISAIAACKRSIDAEDAVLLGHWFGTSAAFWMNLQTLYDLRRAEQTMAKALKSIPTRRDAAA